MWGDRALSMPTAPGGQDQLLASLRNLLQAVRADGASPETVRLVDNVRPRGLVERAGRGVWRLTEEGSSWLESQDHEYLIGVFHANIRFVGELLEQLDAAVLTHNQLLTIAGQDYGLDWGSLDQLRRRTGWLRAAGFVELNFDATLLITDDGRRLLARLDNYRPDRAGKNLDTVRPIFELPPAPTIIQNLLAGLSPSVLGARRRTWGYIPGTIPLVDAFKDLVKTSTPSISRQGWVEHCASVYGTAESSASSALSACRGAGLIEQTGIDLYRSTELAEAWIASSSDINLVRILHGHFRFVGELLHALKDTGNTTELAALAESFNVTSADTQRRLALFKAVDLVEEVGTRRYRLTPIGEALASSLPLEGWASSPKQLPPKRAGTGGETGALVLAAEEITEELTVAARAAHDHERLERAVAAALAAIGFQVEHRGGSGGTDVIATSPLAADNRFTVIADAKASAKGEVGAFDAVTLREHKERHGADCVIAVGERFGDSRTVSRAKTEGVGLLTTPLLARLVDLALKGLVGIQDLRMIFSLTGLISDDVVNKSSRSSQRLNAIAKAVVFALAEEAAANDEVTEGALSAHDLYMQLRGRDDAPSRKDIEIVLELIASPFVRGLTRKGDKFSLSEHVGIVAGRLRFVAELLSDIDVTAEAPI